MSFITQIYVLTVALAFLSSLIQFRRDRPLHLNVFAILLAITFAIELSVLINRKENAWLYNAFILPEFMTYAWFFYRIIQLKKTRKAIFLFFIFFPIFWFITIYLKYGFKTFNSNIIVVGAFFTVFMSISYYYQLLASEKLVKLSKHTEFWIATGMMIFYSCQLPFFGLLNYLYTYHKVLAGKLVFVLQGADAVMYLLFTYAFLCQLPAKKS